ncbi:MAG TPA: TonB family protein [Thermoanaerobaculia bacterium]|jgi:TonB family protein|nr:TonB family protein [Thermoanaerobaculia bacterium]
MTDSSPASRTILTALLLLSLAMPAISQEMPKAEGPPYRVGGEITRPEIISSTRPIYTELARRARVMGTVIVEAVIDEHGDVTDAKVLKGLPMGLDQAAVNAIKAWKFRPATREGQPVPVYYVLTVNFQVDGSPFGDGPIFAKFAAQNPEFVNQLRSKRYQEASEILDRWAAVRPDDPAIPLARIHILLEQGQLQEALQKALDDQGPERDESLFSVGSFALKDAIREGGDRAAEAIEIGLQAETAAMATNPKNIDAIRCKSWLLQSKAELTRDPGARQALVEEANRLQKQATELQSSRSATPEPRRDRR